MAIVTLQKTIIAKEASHNWSKKLETRLQKNLKITILIPNTQKKNPVRSVAQKIAKGKEKGNVAWSL